MKPDSQTTTFAVLGHPVAHSLSPAMHNASLRALGMNAVYLAYDVAPQDVAAAVAGMARLGFGGTNITIPLKHAACAAVAQLAPCASRLGVVNTIAYHDGTTTGYNTDGVGLLADLAEQFEIRPAGLKVLILGCGGAGRAAALTLAAEGAASISLANRSPARAEAVAADLASDAAWRGRVDVLPAASEAWTASARTADLIVQCTSSGMSSEDAPLLPPSAFRRGQFFYDLVYTSPRTPTMLTAESAGARCANGLGMLLHQGAASFHIWTGRDADLPAMRAALEEALRRKKS